MTGVPHAASTAAERASSESPFAIRASVAAVAGATTTTSAHRARLVCGLGSSPPNSVPTGAVPVIAAIVCGPRNSAAEAVITVRTTAPRSIRRLAKYAAL